MKIFTEKVFLSVALFIVLVSSSDAKSLEKRDAKPNYFEDKLKELDLLRNLPFVGALIGPYIGLAQNLIRSTDAATGHDISSIFNGVMPCHFSGPIIQCRGTVDQKKLRHLAKKLLQLIPSGSLPPSMGTMLKLATDLI